MFRLRPNGAPAVVTVWVEGRPVQVPEGASAAAAVFAAGFVEMRTTALSGAPRAPYCMMGACFECLAEIDGAANQQSCMVEVRDGMQICRQSHAHRIAGQ